MKTIKIIVLAAIVTLTTTSTTFAGDMPTGRNGIMPTGVSSQGDMPTGQTLADVILGLVSIVY